MARKKSKDTHMTYFRAGSSMYSTLLAIQHEFALLEGVEPSMSEVVRRMVSIGIEKHEKNAGVKR